MLVFNLSFYAINQINQKKKVTVKACICLSYYMYDLSHVDDEYCNKTILREPYFRTISNWCKRERPCLFP